MTMILERRIDGTTGEMTETEREMTPDEEASARELAVWKQLRVTTGDDAEAMTEKQFRRQVLKILKMLAAMAVEDD